MRGKDVFVVAPLREGWERVRLQGAEGRWRDVLSGREIRLAGRPEAREAVRAPAGGLLVRA